VTPHHPEEAEGEDAEEHEHEERAQQSELLAQDREDEVVVRLRQVGPLLPGGTQTDPRDPARAEAPESVVGLVAGPGRVVAAHAEEVHDPADTGGVGDDERHDSHHTHQPAGPEPPDRQPGDEQRARDEHDEHQGRPHVVAGHHETDGGTPSRQHGKDLPPVVEVDPAAADHQPEPEGEPDLHELGGLQVLAETGHLDPVAVTAHGHPEGREDQRLEDQAAQERRPGEPPVGRHRQPGGEHEDRQADEHELALREEVRVRVAVVQADRGDRGGGEDHHDADHEQEEGRPADEVVGQCAGIRGGGDPRRGGVELQPAACLLKRRHPRNSSTALANASPRSA